MSHFRQDAAPRRTRARFPGAIAAVGLVAALCAGCSSSNNSGSSSPTPTVLPGSANATATSNAALCSNLQALNGTVNQLKSLDPNSVTADQLMSLLEQASSNVQSAVQNATGTAKAKLAGVQAAFSALTAALSALPTSVTPSQAYQAVQPQINGLVTALGSVGNGVGCPSVSASAAVSSASS